MQQWNSYPAEPGQILKGSSLGLGQSQKGPEYGLGSVIRDLDKEVGIACELAYNLNSILGVSNPPSDNGTTQSASGHFGAVSDALNRLRYANQNISRAIQHLNS